MAVSETKYIFVTGGVVSSLGDTVPTLPATVRRADRWDSQSRQAT